MKNAVSDAADCIVVAVAEQRSITSCPTVAKDKAESSKKKTLGIASHQQ